MWLAYAFASAGFAGVTAILAKIGIKNTDSNLATAIRTVVILIFSWLMVFIVGSQNTIAMIEIKTLVFLILSGFATGASWLCYFKALQLGDVNKVTPIDKSSIILTMLFAFLILGEPITWMKAVSMVAIGTGTYMMIELKKKSTQAETEKLGENAKEENKSTDLRWMIYAAFSAVFASLTSILGKIGIAGVESNLGTAIRTIVVLIMAWVVVFVLKKQDGLRHIDKKSWIFICLSGITTGLSWLCYYKALQEGQASVVVPIDKLSIVVTIAFSSFILKEKLSKKSTAGLCLIVAGTLLLLV